MHLTRPQWSHHRIQKTQSLPTPLPPRAQHPRGHHTCARSGRWRGPRSARCERRGKVGCGPNAAAMRLCSHTNGCRHAHMHAHARISAHTPTATAPPPHVPAHNPQSPPRTRLHAHAPRVVRPRHEASSAADRQRQHRLRVPLQHAHALKRGHVPHLRGQEHGPAHASGWVNARCASLQHARALGRSHGPRLHAWAHRGACGAVCAAHS